MCPLLHHAVEKCPQSETSWKLMEVDLKFELKLIEVDPVALLTLRNSPLPVPLRSNEPLLHQVL